MCLNIRLIKNNKTRVQVPFNTAHFNKNYELQPSQMCDSNKATLKHISQEILLSSTSLRQHFSHAHLSGNIPLKHISQVTLLSGTSLR